VMPTRDVQSKEEDTVMRIVDMTAIVAYSVFM
jgi:hypothetical protein